MVPLAPLLQASVSPSVKWAEVLWASHPAAVTAGSTPSLSNPAFQTHHHGWVGILQKAANRPKSQLGSGRASCSTGVTAPCAWGCSARVLWQLRGSRGSVTPRGAEQGDLPAGMRGCGGTGGSLARAVSRSRLPSSGSAALGKQEGRGCESRGEAGEGAWGRNSSGLGAGDHPWGCSCAKRDPCVCPAARSCPSVSPQPCKGGFCAPLNAGVGRERGKPGQTGACRLLMNTPA